jgi:hypothetical protein
MNPFKEKLMMAKILEVLKNPECSGNNKDRKNNYNNT